MLSCILGNNRINCFDSNYSKEELKKWANKNILLCPVCKKPYEYCHGKVIMPYFRHKDKESCQDKYSESETKEHLVGKKDLYNWISKQHGVSDVVLEGWLQDTKQRPDIMFKYKGSQYVIEYQCTPIASEYCERHELYQAAGINDIWICGTEKYFNSRRTKFIDKVCDGYYCSNNHELSIVNESYAVGRIKTSCCFGVLNNKYINAIDINTYAFDGSIYNILCGHQSDVINKKNLRMQNRENHSSSHDYIKNKYFNMQMESYKNTLKYKLKELSNDNWKFYILYNHSRYKTFEYIMAIPTVAYDIGHKMFNKTVEEDRFDKEYIHKKLFKIRIDNLSGYEVSRYIHDETYLKNELLTIMKKNEKLIIDKYIGSFRILK